MADGLASVVSYPDRGPWGDSSYRGNTTGHLIKDLIKFYKPDSVLDPMEGSGTTGDVCRELGIEYDGFDLKDGFDLFTDELPPKHYDLIFFHPPYWDIIQYSDSPRDMSNAESLDEYLHLLFKAIEILSQYLSKNGVLVLQIGDKRRRGEYYPLGAYVQVFRRKELKAKLVKVQHNMKSSAKKYGGNFIPIIHEEVLVMADFTQLTWRELVLRALEELGGEATLSELYETLKAHPKREKNRTYKATIRRTVQESARQVDLGKWAKPD